MQAIFLLYPCHVLSHLKCLWTENCFYFVLKFTIKNTRFQSLSSLGLKLTILQAFKVVLFYPQKWSGEWVEFNPKWPSRDVTLVPWVYLRCHSFLLASERIWKKTCPEIPKAALLVWYTSNAIPPCLPLFFLVRHIVRTIVEPKWRQKLISRGILAARFNTIFEGKNAGIWRLVKSSIWSLDFSNFGNVFFKANFKTKDKRFSVHRHF